MSRFDMGDTKRRLDLATKLALLTHTTDKDNLDKLAGWAITGQYQQLYPALLLLLKNSDERDNDTLIHVITSSGFGAGMNSKKIVSDMADTLRATKPKSSGVMAAKPPSSPGSQLN